jgi:chemotaxis protein CheY-P-specific phosphatase CheC
MRTLGERGLRHAGESVGAMIGRPMGVSAEVVRVLPPDQAARLAAESGKGLQLGLRLRVDGHGAGCVGVLVPVGTAYRLLDLLMGTAATRRALNDVERSAIQEVANVAASAFLNTLGDGSHRRLLLSAPEMHVGQQTPHMLRAVREFIRALSGELLVVQATLADPGRSIAVRFIAALDLATPAGS